MRLRGKWLTIAGCLLLTWPSAFGQTQEATPEFDVISVKPRSEKLLPRAPSCRGDRFAERGVPLLFLTMWAYQLPASRIQGLPAWAHDIHSTYDIEAKASGAVSDTQCRMMFNRCWRAASRCRPIVKRKSFACTH